MFTDTIEFIYLLLGEYAFSTLSDTRHRPSKIIYDPLMFVASSDEIVNIRTKLLTHKQKLRDSLKEMYEKNEKIFSGRSTNSDLISKRNDAIRQVFISIADNA